MTDPSENASERVVNATGLLRWLGVTVGEEADGRGEVLVTHREELTNPNGDDLHGGVVATVVDNAAGTAVRSVLADPEAASYATTELNLSYLRPATGDLRAEARVRKRGRSLVVVEVDVESDGGDGAWRPVAVGRVTYFVVDDGGE